MNDVTEKDEDCYLYVNGEFVGFYPSKDKACKDIQSALGEDIILKEGEVDGFSVIYID